MIAVDGWQSIADGKPNTDLIPTPLIVDRYFAAERDAIEALEAAREAISRQMEEMDEEHGGEEGLLAEGRNDKGKLTKVSVNARLKEIKNDPEADDERKALESYASLIEKEAAANKKTREAQAVDACIHDGMMALVNTSSRIVLDYLFHRLVSHQEQLYLNQTT